MPTPQAPASLEPRETVDGKSWYDARTLPLEGQGWSDTEAPYDRLPARAKDLVRPDVWTLSHDSAGMLLRFSTNATAIHARWTLRSSHGGPAMDHMPATGVSGLDLYVRQEEAWRYLGTARAPKFPTNESPAVTDIPAGWRDYLLYLPLYNGVERLEIGLPVEAKLRPAPPRPTERSRPICFYGTSVTQGGCASRPGMAYPAILGRWLEYPTINLGFSGNGRMEMEVVRLLTELGVAMHVIDCLGNMTAAQIAERTGPLVQALRAARPTTPIVLLGNVPYVNRFLRAAPRERYQTNNAALLDAYLHLIAAGVPSLYHIPGDDFYGHDGEATVDAGHANDIGFLRMAQVLGPALRPLLAAVR